MSFEDYEKLPEDEQEAVRDDCLSMAWDWVCDHYSEEEEETLNGIAEEIWGDFLREID